MIVLFGAGGQLGRELTEQAAQAGAALRAFARSDVDITNAAAVENSLRTGDIDLVVNAAAYTGVDQAEQSRDAAFAVNELGAAIVAQACADARLPLVHISSDYVFDGAKSAPYQEDDAAAPLSVYGKSKLAGEQAVRRLNPRHFIIRTAWVYSVHGRNFLKTIVGLAAKQDELQVVADRLGCPTSATEVAQAILRTRSKCDSAHWGTYHFAGRGITTWHGFACRIVDAQARFTGRRPKVKAVTDIEPSGKALRPRHSALDSSKFQRTFDMVATPWEMAVDRTVGRLFRDTQC